MSKKSCVAAVSIADAILRMAIGELTPLLYALFHTFRYRTYATTAVSPSVHTNAHHTPAASKKRLNTNAAGMITATYLITEMTRDAIPCPNASKAPEQVTETADMINPRLMICRAVIPIVIVSVFSVKSPISSPGINQHSAVPMTIIPAVSSIVRR